MLAANERRATISKKKVFIGSGNNQELIKSIFKNDLNYSITTAANTGFTNNFYFKWVQTVKSIDYNRFNENSQLVNHIENIKVIACKTNLHQTLTTYYQDHGSMEKISLSSFYPQTFILDQTKPDLTHDELSFKKWNNGGVWIYKPSSLNCGKGITLIDDITRFKNEYFLQKNKAEKAEIISANKIMTSQKKNRLKKRASSLDKVEINGVNKELQRDAMKVEKKKKAYCFLSKGVIQKYLENPLLLEGKKFDYRCYCFIACAKPLLVYFHPGYLRLSMNKYNMENVENEEDRYTHLTNAAVQKKHPDFKKEKENTIWSMEKFFKYLSEVNRISQKEIENIHPRIKRILTYVIKASEKKLSRRNGTFELLGCDILFDDQVTPYLLEVNTNPAIFTDTTTQLEVIPKVVQSTINIALKINEKPEKIVEVVRDMQFDTFGFELIYNEANNYSFL